MARSKKTPNPVETSEVMQNEDGQFYRFVDGDIQFLTEAEIASLPKDDSENGEHKQRIRTIPNAIDMFLMCGEDGQCTIVTTWRKQVSGVYIYTPSIGKLSSMGTDSKLLKGFRSMVYSRDSGFNHVFRLEVLDSDKVVTLNLVDFVRSIYVPLLTANLVSSNAIDQSNGKIEPIGLEQFN